MPLFSSSKFDGVEALITLLFPYRHTALTTLQLSPVELREGE